MGMSNENIHATLTVNAPAQTVFDVLADPTTHAAIDGTGWVRDAVDGEQLTATGQIFRIGMYHDNQPNKHYEIANRVEVLDRPRAIAWQPGSEPRHDPGSEGSGDGPIEFGGWIWRYDLESVGAGQTEVTLTYDWSGVPPDNHEIEFPPFPRQHLDDSLKHLAELVEQV